MSDSELNKADGCDIFLSFIIVIVLVAGFFIFQAISEPDDPRGEQQNCANQN